MEHALGVFVSTITRDVRDVLILVLVEHALGDSVRRRNDWPADVLILVLVEHALGERVNAEKAAKKVS